MNAVVEGRWRTAVTDARTVALCAFAEKLTREPRRCSESDLVSLREHGLDDRALHDVVLVIAYFNFVNRIAAGLCVALEEPESANP